MAGPNLTAERLRELLDYDPLTGVFTNRVQRGRRGAVGAVAGCFDASRGYWNIRLDGQRHKAHRLAWLYMHGRWPDGEVDHRDHDKLNNRIGNLRDVTHAMNGQNRTAAPTVQPSASGWRARVWLDGRLASLGQFNCPKQAALAAHDARCVFFPGYRADDAERREAILRVLDRASRAGAAVGQSQA